MSASRPGRGVSAAARAGPVSPLLERVRRGIIGEGELMDGPFGPRRVTYADYTASGRSIDFIEDFIRDAVLPLYANTHTESSGTGLQTSRLREDAAGSSATPSAAPRMTWSSSAARVPPPR